MAIFLRVVVSHGNIRHPVDTEILPHSVWCPVCQSFQHGVVTDINAEEIEPECGCDLEEYIDRDDHNNELDELNNEIDDKNGVIEELETEVKDLEEEVERLNKELLNAEQ